MIDKYSTDIEAARLVVKKMKDSHRLDYKFDGKKATFFNDRISYSASGESEAHAICLAALKAVGHDFEDSEANP